MNDTNRALTDSWQLALHDLRPATVATYLRDVGAFCGWLEDQPTSDLLAVTKHDVQRWIVWGKDRGLKGSTIRSRLIALQAFYRWALDEGEITAKPTDGVTVSRGFDSAPDVLSDDEIRALLKTCEGTTYKARRDQALFRLMLATGLRVSEIVGLDLGDLDLLNRLVAVRDGKGGKPRVTRFDPGTAAALDRYRRVRARHRYAGSPKLWLGERGPWTVRGVAEALDRRGNTAGIGHVYPHQMRHTFADRYLTGGGKEGDLMVLGGWESETVMRKYGRARKVDRALQGYDDANPMRGL